ncbi:MAG TPA: ribosomal L7Ae/L30e/S12e/Gadd45 family protein [Candidatus Nanoarchaeia archaeon]|nr:ribosomal L7Ae/L30e/S12e/Gadd45 family protein [Candidatus Nanoarchaeia archaeon]
MAKKEIDEQLAEVRQALKSKKLVIGTERTLKSLKIGGIQKVFLAANCPEQVKADVAYYARIGNAAAVRLKYDNEELGVICKKPFAISILGVKTGNG